MKFFLILTFSVLATNVLAKTKTISKVNYVYVLDIERSFDFSGDTHECGSNIYRTKTETEEIANRKFSLVLAAYTAGKRLTIDTRGCDGNRMLFGWVRILD